MSDNTTALIVEREKYTASLRAEARAEMKSAQASLFDDVPQNPLLKDT